MIHIRETWITTQRILSRGTYRSLVDFGLNQKRLPARKCVHRNTRLGAIASISVVGGLVSRGIPIVIATF